MNYSIIDWDAGLDNAWEELLESDDWNEGIIYYVNALISYYYYI